jgi:hypothetical protein
MMARRNITPAMRQRADDFLHWRQANGGAVRWDRGGAKCSPPQPRAS